MRLMPDIILLHDFHLGELMLINQRLSQHFIRYERQTAIFTTVEHLNRMVLVLKMLLLL